ncbi:hypothetical protein TNCV_2487051 [Trichonephila clavipes]|uniref:Uncharacterized protein n=1 Tax=Trichonephila clavipes TaxID=2585209 RepID=A0A8X6W023_TRICX|nr:hypothetical protein TNCV_2487051 [Trichonephila clavipes]
MKVTQDLNFPECVISTVGSCLSYGLVDGDKRSRAATATKDCFLSFLTGKNDEATTRYLVLDCQAATGVQSNHSTSI